MTVTRRRQTRCVDERGAIGALEALPFGFLVFVAGTLLLANAWGVLDAKVAASAAAREAARAYVESPAGSTEGAGAEALAAATEAIAGHGRDPGRMTLTAEGPLRFERCAPATFVVSYEVPTLALPWIGGFGSGVMTVSARHREVVDPFRDDVPSHPGAAPVAAC
jgi:hypothetical protein